MKGIRFGKIYSRSDGKLVYHQYVVPLKKYTDGIIKAVNVVTGEDAFFPSEILDESYRMEK